MKIRIRAKIATWWDGVEILIKAGNCVVTGFETKEYTDGMMIEPCARIELEEAQALMDNLWNCGLRPTEESGSAGSMSATQKHLQDMRAIVQKKLNVDLG